ncbi:MAG: Gfo/Idh/MocA family oxidoreductase [Planctomycetota bacterium]|nr:Gfo/Idh/MocA family oxidoreductase [Planctomycetota bacterium]MDA1165903.1 Gfo/Idh/MocA family oxidoreductase [Planctomycetota bacterium]
MSRSIQRREFVKTSAFLVAGAILPSSLRAFSPNGRLRTAHVGVGGMGGSDLGSVSSHAGVEVAALCDVDANILRGAAAKFPDARTFRDYREMISTMGDTIDAVVVSTPDHTHAPAAMTAMNHGKPVYCQKPLTHEVFEARQLRLVAERKELVTQMGIQASAGLPYRQATQMIQSGVIGKISRVHAWSYKNWGYDGPAFTSFDDVPESLDWNLWIGTATMRAYKKGVYHQSSWRKQIDFGTGTLGDMGVHIFDTPYRALALTYPTWVRTTCRPPTGAGHPEKNIVEYEFPGTRYTTETMRWTWYDGADAPPSTDGLGLPDGLKLPGQGSLFVGEEGTMLLPHSSTPQLFPEDKFKNAVYPELEPRNHYHQWVDACMGEGKTSSHFEYAGRLTEALLLGVVANRFPGEKLMWDADQLSVSNVKEASVLLKRTPRDGFQVDGL